jgi:hypothetical protein
MQRKDSPKRQLAFSGRHGVISHNIEIFITITERNLGFYAVMAVP